MPVLVPVCQGRIGRQYQKFKTKEQDLEKRPHRAKSQACDVLDLRSRSAEIRNVRQEEGEPLSRCTDRPRRYEIPEYLLRRRPGLKKHPTTTPTFKTITAQALEQSVKFVTRVNGHNRLIGISASKSDGERLGARGGARAERLIGSARSAQTTCLAYSGEKCFLRGTGASASLLRAVAADAERWATKLEFDPQSGPGPATREGVVGGLHLLVVKFRVETNPISESFSLRKGHPKLLGDVAM
ncbi:hypothetical protein EDB84DRAFT_1674490 [Lactarius hengduanensis]|nr:hypothetical protein EDB84DRAFT_1674490 [Lactarius hengduanensis]